MADKRKNIIYTDEKADIHIRLISFQEVERMVIGYVEEIHGHKGTVKVTPVKGSEDKIMGLKSVYLVDKEGKSVSQEVYDVRKYRGGRFLLRFRGLRWKAGVEELVSSVLAV